MSRLEQFERDGWLLFAYDQKLACWARHALTPARAAVRADENRHWFRYGGTWFVGVNALANDADGAVADGPPLAGEAVDFIRHRLGLMPSAWDRAQVSVCYPGYPQPMAGESEAAFRYRLDRDAAHVDGLLRHGPRRRRFLRECHAFVLGIPLVEVSSGASPFVVWQGSHHIVRQRLAQVLAHIPTRQWERIDITDAYHRARREVFASCRRVEITARPGEAYLVHRLALHGMAPWRDGATAGPDGRMIAYFRPHLPDPARWLAAP